jgi:F-type H+-transporting ATPase subunit delta
MHDRAAVRRYARALFEAATDPMKRRAVGHDLAGLAGLSGEVPELLPSLASPALPLEARRKLLADVVARLGVSETSRTFLNLLLERKRVGLLPDIRSEFEGLVREAEGRLRVEVTSAAPLSPAQGVRLKSILEARTGRRVDLAPKVDPALIAGVRLRIGDTELDSTLSSLLTRMKDQLLRT